MSNMSGKITPTGKIDLGTLFSQCDPVSQGDGIVGIRYRGKKKGIINDCSMKSFCETYFQIEGKAYNISISSNYIIIKGLQDEEQMNYVYMLMKFYFEKVREEWKMRKKISLTEKDVTEDPFLYRNFLYSGEKIDIYLKNVQSYKEKKMFKDLEIESIRIINACFSYHLEKSVILVVLASILNENFEDIHITYHNAISTSLIIRYEKNGGKHLVKINEKGNISQHSSINELDEGLEISSEFFSKNIYKQVKEKTKKYIEDICS